jgi:hypothetical protein
MLPGAAGGVRGRGEQQQTGGVRQAPQQVQALSRVPSRAVQQEHQRGGAIRTVGYCNPPKRHP